MRETVKEVFEEYCEFGRNGKEYTTIKKQDSLWNNHLKDRFGSKYIDDIIQRARLTLIQNHFLRCFT